MLISMCKAQPNPYDVLVSFYQTFLFFSTYEVHMKLNLADISMNFIETMDLLKSS